jgi:transmembrane sensor
VDFTGQQRDLSLTDGAAYFQVHHDARHPFVVTAGNIKVTAVGTAFDLRKESNITIVTVEEGAVNVVARSSGTNAGRKWRVEAGQRLSYSGEGNATIVVSADAGGGSVKWWDGELAYAGERLGTVIDDVNRYSARRIVIDSDAIAARPYTGTVFTGSIDVWLRAIEDLYHLKAQTTADGETVLSAGE